MKVLKFPLKTERLKLPRLKEKLFNELIKYLTDDDISKIEKAYEFAKESHKGTKRYSGDDYIVHPVTIAYSLSRLRMDQATIIASLLHDTIEDTSIEVNDIRKAFSTEVATIVESVTKLSNIKINKSWFPLGKTTHEKISEYERQIGTIRKMLIAMSRDVRVIFIKLADKIHNLETLKFLPPDKQERIAKEAIEIYAPIAGRLGMGEWRGLLEDLSFPFVYPEESRKIKELAIPEIKEREKYLKRITVKLKKILSENKIKHEINFRAKKWYSLFRKLNKYNDDLDKIHDLIAVRIIVNSIEDCYAVLGLIHADWRPLVGKIKDYIALPKPNGYKSIHTTVFADEGQIVEFQVRTKEMHHQAEFGIAANWIYQEKKVSKLPSKNDLKWIDEFNKLSRNIKSPEELFKSLTMDLFEDRIFVFTPQGDVKDLPQGATPVDFAYYVHTALGNHCSGAKINGKIAQLNSKLQNGDIVEIIEKKNAHPHSDWLNFTKTSHARSQIKKVTKGQL
ncbi:MAG: RelA/SpoT family protein [bacterium]